MQDRQEGPVPAELQELPGGAVLATVPPADPDTRDWLMVRTAACDWAGKVSKGDWASFQRPLADWQVRVLGEAYELQERMDKLVAFVAGPGGANLQRSDRRLLNRQWFAMDSYLQALRERIAGFGIQS